MKSTNVSGGTDVSSTQYDFSGKVVRSYVMHQKSGTNSNIYKILTKNNYDNGGRLVSVSKRVNDNNTSITTDKVILENSYDELGQLKSKELAPEFESNAGLESITYDYNIRGWMLGANREYAKSGSNANHFFGFDLGYDQVSIKDGSNTIGNYAAQYNGNIGGTVWKSTGDDERRKYHFTYDAANRLAEAAFEQFTGSSFNLDAGLNFSVENLSYDGNGNILRMDQNGWKVGGSEIIDELHYHYFDYSNRLKSVVDNANDTTTKLGDFRTKDTHPDFSNTSSSRQDYWYDGNGNMVRDLNKTISTSNGSNNGISYNQLNLPKEIEVEGKGTINYVYDASGAKLKKIVYDEATDITRTTLYMFGIYEQDTLQFLSHEEGRIRAITTSGDNGDETEFFYDYFLKDHLGNIRMTLTEEIKSDPYESLSFEEATRGEQDAQWENPDGHSIDVETVRVSREEVPNFGDQNSNGDYVGMVNSEQKLGAAKLLKVMAGDRIHAKIEYYYDEENFSTPGNNALEHIASNIIGAITNSGAAGSLIKPGGSIIGSDLENNNELANILDVIQEQDPNSTWQLAPKAYLAVLFFDERFQYDASSSYIEKVIYNPGQQDEIDWRFSNAKEANKNGYAYVFFINESEENVYFDNFILTHERGRILDETHYYPFGLSIAAISSKAASSLENRYKYNGKEEQKNEFTDGSGLEWTDYGARMYDNQVGRWFVIDPLAINFVNESNYGYVSNNPILYIDENGLYKYPKNKAVEYQKKYPTLTAYLKNHMAKDVMRSEIIKNALIRDAGFKGGAVGPKEELNLNNDKINALVQWGSGPNIMIVDDPGGNIFATGAYEKGITEGDPGTIFIHSKWASLLESASAEDKPAILLAIFGTILHETCHYGDQLDGAREDQYHPGEPFIQEVFTGEWVDGYLGWKDDGNLYGSDFDVAKKVIKRKTQDGLTEVLPTMPNKDGKRYQNLNSTTWRNAQDVVSEWFSTQPVNN